MKETYLLKESNYMTLYSIEHTSISNLPIAIFNRHITSEDIIVINDRKAILAKILIRSVPDLVNLLSANILTNNEDYKGFVSSEEIDFLKQQNAIELISSSTNA
ncbi:MAG: hypothetical protein WCK31_01525 [bacterium]